jgi:hypothetical protein
MRYRSRRSRDIFIGHAESGTKSQEHDRLRSSKIVKCIEENFQVPGEIVFEAFEVVVKLLQPVWIVLCFASLGFGEIWVARSDVPRERRRVIGEQCADGHDFGVDLSGF